MKTGNIEWQRGDLTEDLDLFIEVFGQEGLEKAIKHFGGLALYFPRTLTHIPAIRERHVDNMKNPTQKRLARELGMSETKARLLLKESRERKAAQRAREAKRNEKNPERKER